jgi:MFS family permease
MMAGYAPLFNATAGVFARPLAAEFGWGRSQASLSYAASMFGLAIVSPLVGVLMDRFGIRRVILASAVIFGLATAAMALQNGSMLVWIGLSVIVGVSGAATSVLGYLAVLPQWFDRRLGLALGIAMCGLGAGTVVLPMTAQALVTTLGWRVAYVALGAGSIVLSMLACSLLRERIPGAAKRARSQAGLAVADGVPLAKALRDYRLWVIWLVFVLSSAATLSLGPHLPSLFADRGFDAATAAKSASMVGVGLLVGRLATGLLIDRIHAPLVAGVFFIGGAIGVYLLRGSHDYTALLVATTLIGLTIGAEGDLISYLVRSYFGLASFGSLFGIAFSGYGLGAVIGPIGLGAWFDRHGSYDVPLLVLPCMLLLAAGLVLVLGRYRASGHHGAVTSPASA